MCAVALGAAAKSGDDRPLATQLPQSDDQLIETDRLPIRLHADFLPATSEIAVGAGAIAEVAGHVLIMDRMGRFFLWASNKATPLSWPVLPNARAAFEAYWKAAPGVRDLRAHDVKFDPQSHQIYVSFESFDEEQHALRLKVARLAIDPTSCRSLGAWAVVFTGDAAVAAKGAGGLDGGGALLLGHGQLYFSSGDYVLSDYMHPGQAPPAQDPAQSFGKVYRMTLPDGRPAIFTLGHRNPQGLALRADGTLVETEHGPRGGDKLNVLEEGKNYGWPYLSEGARYGTYDAVAAAPAGHAPFQEALYNFVPSIAPTALIELQGFDAAWNGDLLIASLKARSVFRVRVRDNRVVLVEPIWVGFRVRDLMQRGGEVLLWTDDGSLVTLSVDREQQASHRLTDSWMTKRADFAGNCAVCHAAQGGNVFAPPLDDVFGRPIGKAAYGRYSKALLNHPGVWDENTLRAYIKYPSQFAPGTTMPDVDLSDERITRIIADLKQMAQYQHAQPVRSRGLLVAP